jgi:hypothetical protein
MTAKPDMVREVEGALARLPERTKSGRFAVYVPSEIVIGTYDQEDEARAVAARWAAEGTGAVVVDREA